jgi:MoxR-like ATPase
VNIHLLGGAGHREVARAARVRACVEGATLFEKAMNPALTPDAVIGGYDMPRYARTGEFVRKLDGAAPTAHIIFLDEWFRANGAMLTRCSRSRTRRSGTPSTTAAW